MIFYDAGLEKNMGSLTADLSFCRAKQNHAFWGAIDRLVIFNTSANTHLNAHTISDSFSRHTSYLQLQHICLGGKSLAATQSKRDHIKFLYLLTIHYHNWLCLGFQGKVDVGVLNSSCSGRKKVPLRPHLQLQTPLDLEFIYRVNSMIEASFSSVWKGDGSESINATLILFFHLFCCFLPFVLWKHDHISL